MIAKFKKTERWPLAALALFAVLALVTLTDARSQQSQARSISADTAAEAADPSTPPSIVATSPAVGAMEVDPSLSEITVTFDRDMGGGFSWTGSGPDYPPGIEGSKPNWRDKRTCVLPVKLEAGHYYRVGINSKSYQNFRSAAGVPCNPSAIYFTTRGAAPELRAKVLKPIVLSLTPINGARDVDQALTELRVTFSIPMGDGCSWCGEEQFPTIPAGKKVYWTEDHLTCVLPVELKPGQEYKIGLNSPSHNNFQSAGGVPLDPVSYSFRTRD